MLDFIADNVPQEKREKALQLVHDKHYTVADAKGFVKQIDPSNTSQWNMEDEEKFRLEIFRTRKDFKALVKTLGNKSMGDVIAHYLGHYKKSDEYRVLKTVRVEEREEKARLANHDVDQCAICREGGSLLICDGCESEWHMGCSKPPLTTIPEGRWECDVCVDRKFLNGRKRILEDIKQNIRDQRSRKKEKMESPAKSPPSTDDELKKNLDITPLPSYVIDAVNAFSKSMHSILSKSSVPTKIGEASVNATNVSTGT